MKKEQTPAAGATHYHRARVLFVCLGNACRSPMAEAIARYDAADIIEPSSAGVIPLGYIADLTKHTLAKNGYSADKLTSDLYTRQRAQAADIIINMTGEPLDEGLREKMEEWIVEDPYGADPETYQRVFESIRRRVSQLAMSLREKRQSGKAVG